MLYFPFVCNASKFAKQQQKQQIHCLGELDPLLAAVKVTLCYSGQTDVKALYIVLDVSFCVTDKTSFKTYRIKSFQH